VIRREETFVPWAVEGTDEVLQLRIWSQIPCGDRRNHICASIKLAANDLPGALVNRWIGWIQLFDFDLKRVPRRLSGRPDGLSWLPRAYGEPELDEEDELEGTIEVSLQGIQVEQGPEQKRRDTAYTPFGGLKLTEEYQGRWNEIGKFLGNMKQPEGRTPKEMLRFWRDATKYVVSDTIFHRRGKTHEPLAKMLVSTEQNRRAMQAAHKLSGHRRREAT